MAETAIYVSVFSLEADRTGIENEQTAVVIVDLYLSGSGSLEVWRAATKGKHIFYGREDTNPGSNRKLYESTLDTLTASKIEFGEETVYVEALNSGSHDILIVADVYLIIKDSDSNVVSESLVNTGNDFTRYAAINFNICADTNRDDNINEEDQRNKAGWGIYTHSDSTNSDLFGAIILFNGDKDDASRNEPDNTDEVVNGPDDVADIGKIRVKKFGIDDLTNKISELEVKLRLEEAPAAVLPDKGGYRSKPIEDRVRLFAPSEEVGSTRTIGNNSHSILGGDKGTNQTLPIGNSSEPAGYFPLTYFNGSGNIDIGIEGITPGAPAMIVAELYHNGTKISTDKVQVRVTPWIASSHEQGVQGGSDSVYVSDVMPGFLGYNHRTTPLVNALSDKYGTRLKTEITDDIWWQDPYEIGWVIAPYGEQAVILALPRAAGDFAQYAKDDMIKNGVGLYDKLVPSSTSSIAVAGTISTPIAGMSTPVSTSSSTIRSNNAESGGNMGIMPCRNDLDNDLGKIIIAKSSNGDMRDDIIDFLKAQEVQDVIHEVDLSWMNLGHIDEVISFPTSKMVPSSNVHGGGLAMVASPEAAWALLHIAREKGGNILSEPVLKKMNSSPNGRLITDILGWLASNNFVGSPSSYSEIIRTNVRDKLNLFDTVSVQPDKTLRRAGYLSGNADDKWREWEIEFVSSLAYDVRCRIPGQQRKFVGRGMKNDSFVSTNELLYILPGWWSGSNNPGDKIIVWTRPPRNVIEMPVLFLNRGGAAAYTNNVVNSLVDGNTLFAADVHIPGFNNYVAKVAAKAGFNVISCDERAYHNGTGSIHCGTNVIRVMPSVNYRRQP